MCFWAPKESGEERERGGFAGWYYTHHQHWLCPPVMHPTPFFSGRELDDLPVISSIINICLLVKVGCRVYNPLHTHTHTSFCFAGFPLQFRFYMKISAQLSLFAHYIRGAFLVMSFIQFKQYFSTSANALAMSGQICSENDSRPL